MKTAYGVAPEALKVEKDSDGRIIAVSSRFWETRHDTARGGAISSLRLVHGSNENLLLYPMGTWIDLAGGGTLTDFCETSPDVEVKTAEDEVRLLFSGAIRDGEGRDSGIRYSFEYRHRWGHIRVHKRLVFPDSGLEIKRLCALHCVLRNTLDHFGYRPAPEQEPSADPFGYGVCQWGRFRPGSHFDCGVQTRFIPRHVMFADFGREGIEWFAGSHLTEWSRQIAGRPGCGCFAISQDAALNGVGFEVSPLKLARESRLVRGALDFHYTIGFPVLSGRAHRPFLHKSFNRNRGNWPSSAEISGWAESGARTAHFHHDGDTYGDKMFWRDGAYPPFGPADMAEYDRVIAACRKHGIRTATYFDNKSLHPSVPAFATKGTTWGRHTDASGKLLHIPCANNEVFGAQMCLKSGWLECFKSYVDTVLGHHALDGVYYDWNVGLYCNNPLHAGLCAGERNESGGDGFAFGPADHWDMDELLDLMEWTRRRVGPEGLVIIHNTLAPCAATENFADNVVAMEWGYGRLFADLPQAADLPLEWAFMGARPRGVIGYGALLPNAPEVTARRFELLCLLTGVAPWPASEYALKLFHPLGKFDLAEYRFLDWRSGAVSADHPSVLCAAYVKRGQAVILIGNTGAEPVKARVTINPAALGMKEIGSLVAIDGRPALPRKGDALQVALNGAEARVLLCKAGQDR